MSEGLLFPPLPHRIESRAPAAARDISLQQFVRHATVTKDTGRVDACRAAFGVRYDDLRRHAGAIKSHTLDHLDLYLETFEAAATRAGATVHWAADADSANRICLDIARRVNAKVCVKSKSMATEEIRLLPALEAAGVRTIETDLGEFIVQLDGDAPSHIVTPMIHKNRASVARAFVRDLGAPYTEDPGELTMIARDHMRRLFARAGLGVSGGNFLIADTGTLVLCTNEGNADLTVSLPPVHVAVVGIEKLIPTMADLPVFLKLLARSATAQPITIYTTCITGPRRASSTNAPADADGPRELHIILLDNGRSQLLREPTRELLRCIRCGACLNACPVYKAVGGGHAYGSVYSGPIGAAITPHLRGLHNYPDLATASSLCGACFHACPVHIDLPAQLIALREKSARRKISPAPERAVMRLWRWIMQSPLRYQLAARLARIALSRLDGMDIPLPGPLGAWTSCRATPRPGALDFRAWWSTREQSRIGASGGPVVHGEQKARARAGESPPARKDGGVA
ncbi:MAG: lactate utilization protein [Phycisphaerae bacterium]|nr:lactate utilization protein [Phycisphaerae bacterium]